MQVSKIQLRDGFVITEQESEETETESGILLNENTDDFLVYAKIVNSSSGIFLEGSCVIYHVLDSESFRDGAKVYSLVHEDKIKGTYAQS